MRLIIRENRRRIRTNARLLSNRLSLVTVIIGRFAGRIGGTIRLGDGSWELAGELLMDMRIERGWRSRRLFWRRTGGHSIILHGKLRKPGGGNISRKLSPNSGPGAWPRRRYISIQRR